MNWCVVVLSLLQLGRVLLPGRGGWPRGLSGAAVACMLGPWGVPALRGSGAHMCPHVAVALGGAFRGFAPVGVRGLASLWGGGAAAHRILSPVLCD